MAKKTAEKTWTIEKFAEAWEKSNTLEEVAKSLGLASSKGLGLTAQKYRRMGLPLKPIASTTPQKKPEDLSKAILLLAKLRKVKPEVIEEEGKETKARLEKERQERKAKKTPT